MSTPGPDTSHDSSPPPAGLNDPQARPGQKDTSLRALIIEAALKILDAEGLTLQAHTITYAAAFRHLKNEYGITVTRGSVHERIWATTRDFRFDVLREIVRMEEIDHANLGDLALDVIEDLPSDLTGATRTTEAIRRWTNDISDADLGVSTKMSFAVLAGFADLADGELATLLFQDYAERTREAIDVLGPRLENVLRGLDLAPRAGIELAPGEVARVLAICWSSTMVGFAIDRSTGNRVIGADRIMPSSDAEEGTRWTPFALVAKAFVDLLWEPANADQALPAVQPSSRRRKRVIDLTDQVIKPDYNRTEFGLDQSHSTRRTRAQLRKLVLQAAIEVADRDGFRLRSESLSYKRVFDQIEKDHGFIVNRSSVHKRMWASHDDFQFEVLAAAVARSPRQSENRAEAMRTVRPTMHDNGSVNLRQTVYDTIRAAASPTVEAVGPGGYFRWYLAKSAVIGEQAEANAERMQQSIDSAHQELIDDYRQRFTNPMRRYGIEVREDHGMDWDETSFLFAVLAISTSFGADFATRSKSEAQFLSVPIRRLDGSGRTDDWSIKALGIRALMDLLYKFPS